MARCESYAACNCTAGACQLAPWLPDGLGDGGDWAANARARGLQVTSVPTVGSVVSYCRGDGYSSFGHCALVIAVYPDGRFRVREENYLGLCEWDDRDSSQADVCGFILAPGMAPGQGAPGGQGAGGQASADLASSWARVQDFYNSEADQLVGATLAVERALAQLA